jgi:Na+/H+ antiporter NhaD/arsenite permease-like protein
MATFLKVATIVIFAVTYFFIIRYYSKKARVVWISVLLLIILNAITPMEAFMAINWNVLGIYVGMLFISEVFIFSKVPDFLAVYLVNKASSVSTVMILIAAFAGILSIPLENVAVVLIVAPIALAIAKRLKVSVVPLMIAIAVASNLQGVSTLIGDPPSMIMAGFAKFTFNDFFIFNGRPSLFFAVQVGAIAGLVVLYFFFRKYKHPHEKMPHVKPNSFFPGFLVILMVLALAVSSLFDPNFKFLAGLVSVVFGAVAVVWYHDRNREDVKPMFKRVDWQTAFFLAGIFILVQSMIKVGLVDDIADVISGVTGSSIVFTYIVIILVSLFFSAFVDNVPYIATMLPVVHEIGKLMGVNPVLFYFGLLIGASVGGNITPVGASANIVAMGIARREGEKPEFWDFVKIGLPYTIAATLASTLFIFFWYG